MEKYGKNKVESKKSFYFEVNAAIHKLEVLEVNKVLPFVSICLAAYNEEQRIGGCLEALLTNTNYPRANYEVIVVDDGSTDSTPSIVRKYPVKLVRKLNGGVGSARNAAVQEAKGEIIAFIESDIIVQPNWLIELVNHLYDEPRIMGVGGQNIPPEDIDKFGKLVGKIYSSYLGGGIGTRYGRVGGKLQEIYHNPGCNVAFKREVYELVGTYNEKLRYPGDDLEFDARVREHGYKLLYNPASIVYHYRRDNPKKFLKQSFAYGRDRGLITKMHWNIFNFSLTLPPLFVLYIVLGLLFSIISPWIRSVYLGAILLYLVTIALGALKQTKKLDEIPLLFLMYVSHHLSYGLGFLRGILLRTSDYKWPDKKFESTVPKRSELK